MWRLLRDRRREGPALSAGGRLLEGLRLVRLTDSNPYTVAARSHVEPPAGRCRPIDRRPPGPIAFFGPGWEADRAVAGFSGGEGFLLPVLRQAQDERGDIEPARPFAELRIDAAVDAGRAWG